MKKENGLFSVTLVFTLLAALCLVGAVNAAEVQLAGVRLDEPVTNLLVRPGWGQPSAIGPLAQLSITPATGATPVGTGASGARAPFGTMPGQMGPGLMGGGGPMGPARLRSLQGGPTQGNLTDAVSDMTGQMAGAMTSMANDLANTMEGMVTGMMGAFGAAPGAMPTATTGQPAAATTKGELRGTQGLQYWLYNKPSGIRVILGVHESGSISTIIAQGNFSTNIFTSQGISLGDNFSALFAAYGYPEKTVSLPNGLLLTYPDQDIRFTLKGMQVSEIAIGEAPAPLPAAAPAPMTAAQQPMTGQAQPPGARPGPGPGGPGGMSSGGVPGGMYGGYMPGGGTEALLAP